MDVQAPEGFRGTFRSDDVARAVYSEAAGIGRMIPMAVAVPADPDDVSTIVSWTRGRGLSLVPRGSGSSMAGGAIGGGTSVVLDLGRMRAMDEPSRDRSLRAGSGVLRGELDRRAATAGLRFPVDPSSGEFCTIGGMAATNAAGPHSLRHGSMRPWVLALDCVFDDGSRAVVRRGAPPPNVPAIRRFMSQAHPEVMANTSAALAGVLKNSSGYATSTYRQTQELVDLFVGSEGTLAIFTAVEVALIPRATSRAGVFVSFDRLEGAVEAAVACRARGAAACELLDRTFLTLAAAAGQALPAHASSDAVLLIEVEQETSSAAAGAAEVLLSECRAHGALSAHVLTDSVSDAELWSFRHAASPAIARMNPRLRSMQFIEDAAVPPESLAAYVRGVRAILDRAETPGVIFGHAGDAHVHVNPLLDPGDDRWRARLERILLDVTELVCRLGGTLSGEHGDGRLRTPLLDRVWPAAALAEFRAVKQAFDPGGVFNPGVKVPIAGQRAVDAVKYDRSLDPLPAEARAALDIVERERGYARFRLDLTERA